MKRAVKILAVVAVVVAGILAVIGGVVYAVYLAPRGEADPGGYAFDLAKARALAESIAGEKPTEIRVETIAAFDWPELMTMAGGRLGAVRMGCFSYQLVTPAGHYIIDTGMDAEIAGAMPMTTFYPEAYARMQAALDTADLIALTHEHSDHIGGLTKNSNVNALHPALRLTEDQAANLERHGSPQFARGSLDGYEPLRYDGMIAIGPGVVLIKAPGHTFGSQLVFVKLADGREVLFLGDVAWMWANVERALPRPRLISEYVLPGGENRGQVLAELDFLNQLSKSEPGIEQIPGHDMELIAGFIETGAVTPIFRVADTANPAAATPSLQVPAEPEV